MLELSTANLPSLPPVDIVVIAYNNPDITFRCLASIKCFGPYNHRVILVDNGSTDAVSTFGPMVEAQGGKYIRLEPNAGPYAAANAGIAAVESEVFGFLCNDAALLPTSMSRMLQAVSDQFPIIGAHEVTGPVYDVTAIMGVISQETTFLNEPLFRPGAFFTCFAAQKKLFSPDSVGPFDEQFKITYGDTDWEVRLADAGITYITALHAPVFHGRFVTRKRMGIEAEITNNTADYDRFAAKWGSRADVMRFHPPMSAEQQRAAAEHLWKTGDQ